MSLLRPLFRMLLLCLLAAAGVGDEALASPPAGPDRQILVMVRHPPDHFRPGAAYGAGYGDEIGQSQRERLARRIAGRYGLTLVDNWPMPLIGYDCFVMAVPDGRTTETAADQVAHDSDVAWTEPVSLFKTEGSIRPPNDPLFAAEPAAHQWRLADLHQIATGRGVRIAVIDSGIEANHPDLAGQLLVNRNFVSGKSGAAEQHGTGVAGIIAAKAGNGVGIAGVAPDARLLGLRACWQEHGSASAATVCDSFSLAKALYFAIGQKADIINLSLTGPHDRLLSELVGTALGRGLYVVAAFDRSRPDGGFPASVPGVIPVSDVALASSHGKVYTAPGHDIPTTEPGGRWFLVNGSSFAAAHVSGLIALVRQRRRSAGWSFVADRSNGEAIDACATLIRAAGSCDCACAHSSSPAAAFP